ncbi:MAG: hypothetical protein AAFW84_09825 [Cyanobacteria bacterium J06635_15]
MSYQSQAAHGVRDQANFASSVILLLSQRVKEKIERLKGPTVDADKQSKREVVELSDRLSQYGDSPVPENNRSRIENPSDPGEKETSKREWVDIVNDLNKKTLKREWVDIVKDLNTEDKHLSHGEARQITSRLAKIEQIIGAEATLAGVYSAIEESPAFKDRMIEQIPELENSQVSELTSTDQPAQQPARVDLSQGITRSHQEVVFVAEALRPEYQDLVQYDEPLREVKLIEPEEPAPKLNNEGKAFEKLQEEAQRAPINIESPQDDPKAEAKTLSTPPPADAFQKPDSVYKAEMFNIERAGAVTTITDKRGGILFQYEINADRGVIIYHDRMNSSHKQLFSTVRKNITKNELGQIMRDPTGTNQVNNLGVLAPEGSHAIAVSHAIIPSGQQSVSGSKYTFSRSGQNGYEILRNDPELPQSQKIVAISRDDGRISGVGQTPAELKIFYEKYHDARTHALKAKMESGRPILKSERSNHARSL